MYNKREGAREGGREGARLGVIDEEKTLRKHNLLPSGQGVSLCVCMYQGTIAYKSGRALLLANITNSM